MKKLILNACIVFVFALLSQLQTSAQSTYLMCGTNTTTDSSGTIYDSGGPNTPTSGTYSTDEDCTFLIAPSCATSITLTFHSFSCEPFYDSIYVYDGATRAAPLLLTQSARDTGATPVPSPVTCTSGYMLIVWHSDVSVVDSGFYCTWTSVIAPSLTPTAAFTIANNNPPVGVPVHFTNTTVDSTTAWIWDFGDGDTARSQNPNHAYASGGTYTVKFIAFHCSSSDTITHTITVQANPHISVTPLTGFSGNVVCGDSTSFTMNVSNTAGGQLFYSTDGSSVGKIKILAMRYGSDPFSEFPHTIAAINQYATNDTIIYSSTIDPGVLSGELIGINILLIPEQESGDPYQWGLMAPVIQAYLNNGGSVIFCGSASSEADCMFNTGVFTGSFNSNVFGFSLSATNLADPLLAGITTATFSAPSATYSMNITNTDKTTIVNYQGQDVLSYRYYGSGKAIFIAFDYYAPSVEAGKIMGNAIAWGGQNALASWIHMSLTTDTVNAGNTSHVTVTFVANSLPAGTYYANIAVSSNDPSNPVIMVPCTLHVTGLPIIGLSTNCIAYGQVMQYTYTNDTFTVVNNGCDTLFLSNVFTSSNSFSLGQYPSYLLPGSFTNISVTFHDTAIGTFHDTITVLNNDTNMAICLSATNSPAPKASTSASSFSQNLRACSDTGSTTLVLKNTGVTGAVPLTFTLGSLPSWITAGPTSGSLNPGDSVIINLNYGSGTFVGGPYVASIVITSNDPQTPIKNVPFTMNVDYNPCISFSQVPNTCTGYSAFTSSSINIPTSYHWDFGDGDSSSLANPVHGYPTNGLFTATLVACNAHGCDTATETINAIITGPKPAVCIDSTIAYCCGIGITLFQVKDQGGVFEFNKTSPDAIDNYKDYTCTDYATLVTNYNYSLQVQTGFTYPELFKMWLDFNNDGDFDSLGELLFVDTALTAHTGFINIPSTHPSIVYGQPLRLRIASDYSGNAVPEPCLNLQFGQVEDYSVFLSFYNGVSELARETSFNVYPNPFNQNTSIDYNLKKSSEVSLEIFNLVGEKVSSLALSEIQLAGKHSYIFSGQPSGVYFVKLTVDNQTSVLKIIKM